MTRSVVALHALPATLRDDVEAGLDRAMCPRCGGGTSREVSLSIRRQEDGVVTFKCYRASCDWFGTTLSNATEFTARKIKPARVYDKPTTLIGWDAKDILRNDYGLSISAWTRHNWRLSADGQYLVMPILDAYGRERGHITRTLYEKPKRVYTYKATCQPFLDWWFNPENDSPVVVVEDTLSACRLSGLGYNSVALLGTGMSREDAKEIASVAGGRPVCLALDRDAFDKAMKLRDRHRHILPIQTVLCLDEDIKNMTDDNDIRGLIDG